MNSRNVPFLVLGMCLAGVLYAVSSRIPATPNVMQRPPFQPPAPSVAASTRVPAVMKPLNKPLEQKEEAHHALAIGQWLVSAREWGDLFADQRVLSVAKELGTAKVECGFDQYATAFRSYKDGLRTLRAVDRECAGYAYLKLIHDALFADLESCYPGSAENALKRLGTGAKGKKSAANRLHTERPTAIYRDQAGNDVVAKTAALPVNNKAPAIAFWRYPDSSIEARINHFEESWATTHAQSLANQSDTVIAVDGKLFKGSSVTKVGAPGELEVRLRFPKAAVGPVIKAQRVSLTVSDASIPLSPVHMVALRALDGADHREQPNRNIPEVRLEELKDEPLSEVEQRNHAESISSARSLRTGSSEDRSNWSVLIPELCEAKINLCYEQYRACAAAYASVSRQMNEMRYDGTWDRFVQQYVDDLSDLDGEMPGVISTIIKTIPLRPGSVLEQAHLRRKSQSR